jgi:formylglycine-generating enzyme required for sulfatase activity
LDMSGNVWEWTRSIYGEWDNKKSDAVNLSKYPYIANDGREDLTKSDDYLRVLRGGSFFSESGLARCAFRLGGPPGSKLGGRGFRVVVLFSRTSL